MKTTITAALLLTVSLAGAAAAAPLDYSVAELLEPCMNGDNDSRDGAVLELECEQYVSGFTDAYMLLSEDGGADGLCLPQVNRADEVRWAFMRWAHENYEKRDMRAADGMLEMLRAKFRCP